MIDLSIDKKQLQRTVKRCRERGIIIPTLEQQKYPNSIPQKIKSKLKKIGLWDITPENLFRITWKNEPIPSGGLYGSVNYVELPPELTGVPARIICLVGKWFPTGAHKVGASFGCLVPRLVTGQFDPTRHKAVWPSTGNYCRGGAYDAALLGCKSIAILPEEMSKERFEWLEKVAGEVIATPGCESNVKEIYDKCWELRSNPKYKDKIVIFNQFDEFGNHLWHYDVTGHALVEILAAEMKEGDRLAGFVATTGSSGTIGAGDYLKELYPHCHIVAGEAVQCPTMLYNGFGGHRIEGIGDKHIPWIHNVKNTDIIVAADDNDCMNIIRLFNEPAGREFLSKERGVSDDIVNKLDLMGISSVGNVICAIKFAKYHELSKRDILFTVWTDSMELYGSRIKEMRHEKPQYGATEAARDFHTSILGLKADFLMDLRYVDAHRVHNLKYYTWIEQQQMRLDELNEQWYRWPDYWDEIHAQVPDIDKLIKEFNNLVGLI